MKVLITGDRDWSDYETVVAALSQFPAGTILIHGKCRGADIICAAIGEALGFVVREYPADWVKYGPYAAGPIRNQQMIDVENTIEEPIDVCLAFHNDILNSRGTKDMVKRAKKAKIEVREITSLVTPS